jgi:dephospho-CoA kinase
MIVIGLTGGIGTGKSSVVDILRRLGATTIDADVVGHEVYAAGTTGFRAIVDAFGPGFVGDDGEIDRAALGKLVFADKRAMVRLNGLVHPLIHEAVSERLKGLKEAGVAVAVVEAAILLEAGWNDLVDEVWVVDAPASVVMDRLAPRFDGDERAIEVRIRSQMSSDERREAADEIIENDGSLDQLRGRVEQVFNTRIEAARGGTNQT